MPEPINFYSGTDALLYTGSTNCSAIVSASAAALGVPAATATAYATLTSNYSTAYLAAINPATRTKLTVEAKNVAKKALRTASVNLNKVISGNASVTNETLMELGFNPRAVRTDIGPPIVSPLVKVLDVVGTTVKVSLAPTTPEDAKGKPKGSAGISVWSFIGEEAPIDINDWFYQGTTGRIFMDIVFDPELAPGTKVWLTAFYLNARGETGPSSPAISTHLQGGVVSLAA